MEFIGQILLFAIEVYFWVIILGVVLSWLVIFEVVNMRNPQAANLMELIRKITEPVYKPIRKYVPLIGGIDISPIIVLFGLHILSSLVVRLFF
jgi:YggT family protein